MSSGELTGVGHLGGDKAGIGVGNGGTGKDNVLSTGKLSRETVHAFIAKKDGGA